MNSFINVQINIKSDEICIFIIIQIILEMFFFLKIKKYVLIFIIFFFFRVRQLLKNNIRL